MATAKYRINISLPDDVKEALERTARRDRLPLATKAGRLLEVALDLEEDQVWNRRAAKRDTKDARFLSSADTWDV